MTTEGQPDLFETDATRTLLDQLLSESRLYHSTKDFKDLLDFVIRLRNVAPFNAMLLQVQKPGVTHVASAYEWKTRFERTIKERARPLLILWPFGPVVTVYDVQDTEGKDLPEDALTFVARGAIDEIRVSALMERGRSKGITFHNFDGGAADAGQIKVVQRATKATEKPDYSVQINRNHSPAVRFVTIAHELAHLFLGHLGPDKALSIPNRAFLKHAAEEIEAESVAYLVCGRNGVKSKSQTYLAGLVERNASIDDVDIYQIMRAAGQVETLLGLVVNTKFEKPKAESPR